MAFRIKPEESLDEGVRRIALDQVAKALGQLADGGGPEPEKAVHDARKRFKKVRAVLRLARGGLGRKLAARENARFRDSGRPLSEVRDAGVLVEAFDELVGPSGIPDHPGAAERIHEALEGRRRGLVGSVLGDQEALKAVASAMEEARDEVKRWDLRGNLRKVLGKGLKRIYRAGRAANRIASNDPGDEAWHEWRKRVKDLWYALDLIEVIRPAFYDGLRDRARKLADALGNDHDLAVLRQTLEDPDAKVGDRAAIEAIGPLIDRRRGELREEARRLGNEVFAEAPRNFSARFDAFWRAWRAEARASRFDPPGAPGLPPATAQGSPWIDPDREI